MTLRPTRARPGLHAAVAVLGILGLVGCKSAGKAAHETAETLHAGYGSFMEAGRAIVDLLPQGAPQDPGEARERMLGQAGQARYRNEELTAARDRLRPQRAAFEESREQLRSERFEESRERFRAAEQPGFRGSLGKAMGATLETTLRVGQRATQPVLGRTIPGFTVDLESARNRSE